MTLAAGALKVLMSLQKGLCHTELLGNAPQPARGSGRSKYFVYLGVCCGFVLFGVFFHPTASFELE